MSEDCFLPRLTAQWNPTRGAWETGQLDLLSMLSELYLETWPASGMTQGGLAYELPTPALPTVDSDSSSSPVLPTPVVTDAMGSRNSTSGRQPDSRHHTGHTLSDVLLPTPTVGNATGGNASRSGSRSEELLLPGVALTLLPTPTVVMNDGEQPATWLARRQRIIQKGINGNGMGMPLPIAMLLLRGESTETPSSDGSESPAA